VIAFRVHGIPAPKGSLRAVRVGRFARVINDNERTKPWAVLVSWAAKEAMMGQPPFDGPINLGMVFILPRPKGRPKRETLPDRRPDLDKLCRNIGDALAGICYVEDSRIVSIFAVKQYGPEPGVEVNVRTVEGDR